MSDASERLADYKAAERKILKGQEVSWGGRRLKFSDLGEIRQGIKDLQRAVANEQASTAGRAAGILTVDLSGCDG